MIKLEPGSSLPGGYRLVEKLGKVGFYISTWHARDVYDQDVVIKYHWTVVRDDYLGSRSRNLHDKISQFCSSLDRLVDASGTPGLAPWLSYAYNPNDAYIFLVRRYYATKLHEWFASARESESRPREKLLSAFQQLAEGLDSLGQLQTKDPALTFDVDENNLFVDNSQAVLTDYGCSALQDLIENSYDGPRPAALKRFVNGQYVFLEYTGGNVQEKIQSALAAVYYRVRLGRPVFEDFTQDAQIHPFERREKVEKRIKVYLDTQQLEFSHLLLPGERAALTRALAINPSERFRSCVEFVQCLST